MSKVYVIEKGAHDYTPAKNYGDIVYLYEDEKSNVFASDALVKEIERKLADSEPDDYLVLSGSSLPCAIAFDIMLNLHGRANVLLYSFRDGNYVLRTIRDTQFIDQGGDDGGQK